MTEFEIYFNDLTEQAQQKLLDLVGNDFADKSNWEVFPIAMVEFEE